jgi:hypothetical protein
MGATRAHHGWRILVVFTIAKRGCQSWTCDIFNAGIVIVGATELGIHISREFRRVELESTQLDQLVQFRWHGSCECIRTCASKKNVHASQNSNTLKGLEFDLYTNKLKYLFDSNGFFAT